MKQFNNFHIPVLLNEVVQYLNLKQNQNYIDCNLGGGGHAKAILEKIGPEGNLLGIDLDASAILAAKNNLKDFKNKVIFHQGNFADLKQIIHEHKFCSISGILFDLGLSTLQLEDVARGFTFQKDEPLEMRYEAENPKSEIRNSKQIQISKFKFQHQNLTAYEVVNKYSERELKKILWRYGEEKFAGRIAREICKARKIKPIQTTFQLAEIIKRSVPENYERGRIHPATRSFQALRIEVNQELENLQGALPQALEILEPNGRLVCISYHSLEDRIIKQFFAKEAKGCICSPELPECRCGHKPRLKILTKKPISASMEEIKQNPRARSAKMRAIEKLASS